ncbi:MAG: FtsH protease activity modulator HflK [Deltaproteobacteria bacterium]|nr:FtsH protease activity modulator HflK [Deltaproteobacteria bacterium]MBW2395039.1 FtsH protease activity modulator HflK [Deltaproteobacteria bacterium]
MAKGDAPEERKAGRLIRRLLTGVLLIVGLTVWVGYTGTFQLDIGEQAVILRFGAYSRTVTSSGLGFHLPAPIETHAIVGTQKVRREEFGDVDRPLETKAETVMQTGDNAIVHLEFVVRYRVANPRLALYQVRNIDAVVRDAAQAAMREVVALNHIDGVLADARFAVESDAAALLTGLLDLYETGIEVLQVELQEVQPPTEVRGAFDDVVAANQDRNRQENEARAHQNQVLPRAEATAAELLESAEAYKQSRIARAEGENARFRSLLIEYKKAPEITRKRLYLETMEEVLSKSTKIIVEPGSVVPYLPLDQVGRSR